MDQGGRYVKKVECSREVASDTLLELTACCVLAYSYIDLSSGSCSTFCYDERRLRLSGSRCSSQVTWLGGVGSKKRGYIADRGSAFN